ncbi:sulfite exporter TauE/SafE family protein [Myroides sp. JBRI-B21084]|uniref:sulfite exporter TauE/SafE family protein n=1 Tax=Myroides sp. JBRI-B21084 TaxID=3119977 RepID=UPI0026E13CAA|nr:sulfite exporter TauE/SafE family protein [Paenimyroides cloacae]WKW46561.1 sulfite exporter TauE/SafE family protein [Paenimyroides cloacae]
MATNILGYFLATLVGISLGLIGSGGSILTVPILVYIIGVNPILATTYSLFVVGSTALIGGTRNALQNTVDFKTVFIFGVPSIAVVYLTRTFLLPIIPDLIFTTAHFQFTKNIALMVLFAVVMIFASTAMIRPCINCNNTSTIPPQINYIYILIQGILVGVLTGLVGAGGGFLIIPALVLFAKMPIKQAVGTSLFIVAINSLSGFLGDVFHNQNINWYFLIPFSLSSILGLFVGMYLSKKINGNKLKTAFGWFVLIMGIYILFKEIFK